MMIYNDNIARPYVYKITYNDTLEYYYGYREANIVPARLDIGSEYFTSSDVIAAKGFDNITIEIIAEFDENEADNYCQWTTAGDAAFEHEQFSIFLVWGDRLLLNGQYRWPIKNDKRFKSIKGIAKSEKGKENIRIAIKKQDRTKANNPHANHTVHCFYHFNYGEVSCSMNELMNLYPEQNLRHCGLIPMINGDYNHHRGWTIKDRDFFDRKCGKNNINYDATVHHWYHKIYGEEKCSRLELRDRYLNLKLVTQALGEVVLGNYTNHRGWIIKK